MDLIPKPDQIVAAAATSPRRCSTADWPTCVRCRAPSSTTARCARSTTTGRRRKVVEHGDPVLLVTPLAAPALCFDLRRGCSLVEHLVDRRPPDLPRGVRPGLLQGPQPRHGALGRRGGARGDPRRSSAHAGGRPVHLVGWSLGGIFALLTAADQPDLPIASVTAVGSPIDVTQVPLVAPVRPLLGLHRAAAGARSPAPTGRWAACRSRW